MKNVIIITDVDFWSMCSGNRTRISALVDYLKKTTKLTVAYTGPYDIDKSVMSDKRLTFFTLSKEEILSSDEYISRLKKIIKNQTFDLVIIEYIHNSYFLNCFPDDCRVVLDIHDIISERTREFAKFNYPGISYELSEETEQKLFQCYDHILVLSEIDYEKVNKLSGSLKSMLCPHPVSFRSKEIKEAVNTIGFIASSYFPNTDAIEYFLTDIWPTIHFRFPKLKMRIYGTVCQSIRLTIPTNVNLYGYQSDLAGIYDNLDIIVNPVRFGAGIKIKNIEALSYGMPLITTSHGARGLETETNKCFVVADTADDFINELDILIKSKTIRQKLANNAKHLINDDYSSKTCFNSLSAFIES